MTMLRVIGRALHGRTSQSWAVYCALRPMHALWAALVAMCRPSEGLCMLLVVLKLRTWRPFECLVGDPEDIQVDLEDRSKRTEKSM
jgi:hypothetical protein